MKEEHVLILGVLGFAWVFIFSMYFVSEMKRSQSTDLSALEDRMHVPDVQYPRALQYVRFAKIDIPETLSILNEYPKTSAWLKHLCYEACRSYLNDPGKGIAFYVASAYESHMIFTEQVHVYVILHELSVVLQQAFQQLSRHQMNVAYMYTMLDNLWKQISEKSQN